MPPKKEALKNWLVQRINPGSSFEQLLRFPSFFEIETVFGCNARCPMCPAMAMGNSRQIMTEALFEKIAEQIATQTPHIRKVNLFRNGEPFLDPHIAERVRTLKSLGVHCVSITSNMSLATPDRAEALLKNGLDVIDMSIDSIEKETYEAIRKGLRFTSVMDNITQFIALRDRLQSPCAIRVRMVLQKSNSHQWDDFYAFWRSRLRASDTVMYHPIHNWGNQLDNFQEVDVSRLTEYPCVALWSLMAVLVDGTVPLCNVDYTATTTLGDLEQQTITDLWTGKTLSHIRAEHLKGLRNAHELCGGCNAWELPSYL